MSSTRKLPSYHHLAVLSAASRTGMTSIQAVITELADVLELSPGSAKEPFTAPTFDLRRSNRLAALVRPFSPPPLALAGSPSLARPGPPEFSPCSSFTVQHASQDHDPHQGDLSCRFQVPPRLGFGPLDHLR